MPKKKKIVLIIGLVVVLMLSMSCAPGNVRFEEKPAGFWAGLWHGLIIVITFIISLFTESVKMYEINNAGNWYNFGFLLGAVIALGGSCGSRKKYKKSKSRKEKEWEEIGVKVEEKVRQGIKNWVDETEESDREWEEIGKKIEEKIKRELKNWAEK